MHCKQRLFKNGPYIFDCHVYRHTGDNSEVNIFIMNPVNFLAVTMMLIAFLFLYLLPVT